MRWHGYTYVDLAWRHEYCGLFSLEYRGVVWYFLDNERYFRRGALYGQMDDGERFAFFSKAVVSVLPMLEWRPEVIHCNDWQTALVPIYLKTVAENVSTVFTIHNIEYQGRYGRDLLEDLFGLDESYFNENMLKFYDDISLVKGAVNAADYVTTVSPNYANELQFSFYAHGLEGVIAANRGKLRGILNGIDMKANDPSTRKDLAARFTSRNHKGKAKCKAALQERLGLKVDPNVPIIACISRLVGHKGFELVCQAFWGIMDMEVQFVLLGTGEWGYEQFFRNAQNEYPGRVSANILYDGALSDAIYAGADLFLMPSIAEPCGLSQMFAMRYGTVPVVRMTGGLLDSVPAYNPEENTGLGFTFGSVDAGDMLGALYRAVGVYYDDKKAWDQLVTRDMEADFSWDRSAQEYVDVYRTITGLE